MRGLAAVLLALAVAGPPAAASQGAPAEAGLARAGAEVAAAAAALAAAGDDAARAAALAQAIAAHEAALAELRGAVIDAEDRERTLSLDLARRRAELAELALALQRIGRTPPPAKALHPQGPIGAARAASTLAWLAPRLQADADRAAAQLKEIAAARALRDRGMEDLAGGLAQLAAARDALAGALERRAPGPTDPAALVPAALARDVDTLTALAERLAALGAGGAADGADGAGAPLALAWPVTGRVLRGYGEPDAAGVRRPGLVIEAAPLSLVTAPAAGRVRYAGPFLDYGYVVVLEPRAGVLVALAGLATLEARAGEAVEAGALLGLLGGRRIDTQEYLMLGRAGSGETGGETLYIEVRNGEGPVDPSPWLGNGNG